MVADGVGGWEAHGIDSGIFSKQLVRNMKSHFDKEGPNQSLRKILVEATRDNSNIGSSTAVMATLNGHKMCTANLGDSGYLILRPDYKSPRKLTNVFKSKEQQYSFNFPY